MTTIPPELPTPSCACNYLQIDKAATANIIQSAFWAHLPSSVRCLGLNLPTGFLLEAFGPHSGISKECPSMKNQRKFPGCSLVTAALVAAVIFGCAALAAA